VIKLDRLTLTLDKAVTPAENVLPGDRVTFTLTLSNSGETTVSGIVLSDVLPAEVDFGQWVIQNGAGVANDVITWSGDLEARASLTIVFTALVRRDVPADGCTVINTARFTWNGVSVARSVNFTVRRTWQIFLPLVTRNL